MNFHRLLTSNFNSLPSVFMADQRVRGNSDFDAFLHRAAFLFVSHHMHTVVGVSLIHRHERIDQGEMMLQQLENWRGNEALVCRKVPIRTGGHSAPVNLLRTSTCWAGVEFSKSPRVFEKFCQLASNSGFVEQYEKLIEEFNLQGQVGLSIYTRDEFSDKRLDLLPLEVTLKSEAANIITLVDPAISDQTISTNWFFHEQLDTGCQVVCAYRCFDRSPGHSKEHAGTIHGIVA